MRIKKKIFCYRKLCNEKRIEHLINKKQIDKKQNKNNKKWKSKKGKCAVYSHTQFSFSSLACTQIAQEIKCREERCMGNMKSAYILFFD